MFGVKRKVLTGLLAGAVLLGGVQLGAPPAQAASRCWDVSHGAAAYATDTDIFRMPNPCRGNSAQEKAVWETFRMYQTIVRTNLRLELRADSTAKAMRYDAPMRRALVRLVLLAGFSIPKVKVTSGDTSFTKYNRFVSQLARNPQWNVPSAEKVERIMKLTQYQLAFMMGKLRKINEMYDAMEHILEEDYPRILEAFRIEEPPGMAIYSDFFSRTRAVAQAVAKFGTSDLYAHYLEQTTFIS